MKKNEILKLEITDITSDGNGVGHINGMAVFVPETAIGDIINAKIVKVLKNYAYGIIESIIKPSNDRIENTCPYFPQCGGCSFRHISYESEKKIKQKIVYDAFTRIGKIQTGFLPILGCNTPDRYRNKAQYPVGLSNGKNISGFYAKRSHRIICGSDCRLLPIIFSNIVDLIIDYTNSKNIPAYDETTGNGILRHIFIRQGYNSKQIMICFVVTKSVPDMFNQLISKLVQKFNNIKSIVMNINPENTNVILGKKTITLWGNNEIIDIMCHNQINISPQAFYQVNTPQAQKLYSIASDFADFNGNELLLDLYCGAGTIGLSMASKIKKIIGVEITPQAIENAKLNAKINNIQNAEFICGDSGAAALTLAEKSMKPDVIILDPPRKGCDINTLNAVLDMNPQKIIMISCNPSTAARDCAILSKSQYSVVKVQSVDLFPRTTHVECVVLLTRNN